MRQTCYTVAVAPIAPILPDRPIHEPFLTGNYGRIGNAMNCVVRMARAYSYTDVRGQRQEGAVVTLIQVHP